MAEWGNAFNFGNDNLWPDLWGDGRRDFKNRWKTAAEQGRVYDLMQLVVEVLSSDHDHFHEIKKMQFALRIACSNFGSSNSRVQHNGVVALSEAFAVACYRGHIDDVRRLSESDNVRDNVDMLGVGLHFALLQRYGRRKREHWDIIRWLMDNTQLRDNSLVLRWAFVVACDDNELEEVRWMLQYRQLAQNTDTIDHALEYALSRHLALVKCVVEHSDVDFNRLRRVGTLLHDVIWRSERRSDLHLVCDDSSSDAEDVYRLVYERGANVNEQDNYGNTPLHVACYHGNQDIVEALMSCGADVNITNDGKRTPAQQAIYSGHEELLRLLDRTTLMDTYGDGN